MKKLFWTKWSEVGGYEVSSKGDKRFSAFNAMLKDGRTIEQHYQCDVKGYDPNGIDWRLGKGKPALDPNTNLWEEYLKLWKSWAKEHPELIRELYWTVVNGNYDYLLIDKFATSLVNQARALCFIINEYIDNDPEFFVENKTIDSRKI